MNPTYDQLLAVFEAAAPDPETPGEWEPPTPLVDWEAAYGAADDPARWLAQPLLPVSGAVAVFAKGGTGKSLLALWMAAGLATGTDLLGPVAPIDVLYLDYEMTVSDVVARLEDMGYDDPGALKALHYASLPTLAPLDTLEGGRAVTDMASHLGVSLVVVDTFGRAVDGEEDRADTVRAWYRWTGQLLKAAGIGFLRIDHAGKDPGRGQRGTSAKNDDVDIVWEMTERDHGEFLLRAVKRRVSWVPERVLLARTDDNGVLGYRWVDGTVGFLAGTKEVADRLDELGAPVDISRRKALMLLRDAGQGRANNVVADALKFRREARVPPLQYQKNRGSEKGRVPDAGTDEKPLEYNAEYQEVPPTAPNWPGGDTYVVRAPARGESPPDPGVIG